MRNEAKEVYRLDNRTCHLTPGLLLLACVLEIYCYIIVKFKMKDLLPEIFAIMKRKF